MYYLELIKIKMFIGINDTEPNLLSLYTNQSVFTKNNSKLKWKIYPINEEEFLIQNILTKKFWRTKIFFNLDCSGEIEFIYNKNKTKEILIDLNSIDVSYKFKIEKLYEELLLKKEYIQIIE